MFRLAFIMGLITYVKYTCCTLPLEAHIRQRIKYTGKSFSTLFTLVNRMLFLKQVDMEAEKGFPHTNLRPDETPHFE